MDNEQRADRWILAYILKSLGFRVRTRPADTPELGMIITVEPCLEPVPVRRRDRRMWN